MITYFLFFRVNCDAQRVSGMSTGYIRDVFQCMLCTGSHISLDFFSHILLEFDSFSFDARKRDVCYFELCFINTVPSRARPSRARSYMLIGHCHCGKIV